MWKINLFDLYLLFATEYQRKLTYCDLRLTPFVYLKRKKYENKAYNIFFIQTVLIIIMGIYVKVAL